MKILLKNYGLIVAGVVVGGVGGFLYWKLVGCDSGTCAITSNPGSSTLYGAMMGGLLFSLFKRNEK